MQMSLKKEIGVDRNEQEKVHDEFLKQQDKQHAHRQNNLLNRDKTISTPQPK